ncbi:MAG: dihydrodipicolinate synthase family protein, partial [Myxococcales bacterium]
MKTFTGTLTALASPFKDGAFDVDAYRAFIEFQIAGGVDGLVPIGTTGEAVTMT